MLYYQKTGVVPSYTMKLKSLDDLYKFTHQYHHMVSDPGWLDIDVNGKIYKLGDIINIQNDIRNNKIKIK